MIGGKNTERLGSREMPPKKKSIATKVLSDLSVMAAVKRQDNRTDRFKRIAQDFDAAIVRRSQANRRKRASSSR